MSQDLKNEVTELYDGNIYVLGGREEMVLSTQGLRDYVIGMHQQYGIDEPDDTEILAWLAANHFTIKYIPLIQTGRLEAEVFFTFADMDLSRFTMDEEGFEVDEGEGCISAVVEVGSLPSLEEIVKRGKDIGIEDGLEMDDLKYHLSLILDSNEKKVLIYFDDHTSIGHHTFTLKEKDWREEKAYIAGIEVTKELQRPLSADDAPYWVSQHESLLNAFLEGAEYKLSQAN